MLFEGKSNMRYKTRWLPLYHNHDKFLAHVCTQIDDEVLAATTPAPVHGCVAPAPVVTNKESVFEPLVLVVHTALAPVIEYVAPALDVTLATPAPVTAKRRSRAAQGSVIEYVAPATPICGDHRRTEEPRVAMRKATRLGFEKKVTLEPKHVNLSCNLSCRLSHT